MGKASKRRGRRTSKGSKSEALGGSGGVGGGERQQHHHPPPSSSEPNNMKFTIDKDRCSDITNSDNWGDHRLDMENIIRIQQSNNTILTISRDKMNDGYKILREQHGLHCGFKLFKDSIPSLSEPSWLGGKQRTHKLLTNNTIFPSFQNLDRPNILPGKCRIEVRNNEQVQIWVNKIWNGECVYYVSDPRSLNADDDTNDGQGAAGSTTSSSSGARVFQLCATTTDDVPLMRLYFNITRDGEPITVHHYMHPMIQENIPSYSTSWELLFTRLIHYFLREYAFLLPPKVLDHLLYECLFTTRSLVTSKKHKLEFLDWKILCADLTLNLPPPPPSPKNKGRRHNLSHHICSRLMDVGSALAAMERWEPAAALYEEISNKFPSNWQSCFLGGNCIQSKGGGDYEAAIEKYSMTMDRIQDPDPNPSPHMEPYSSMLTNLMLMHTANYEEFLRSAEQLRDNNGNTMIVSNQDARCTLAFFGLMHVAGVTAGEDGDVCYAVTGVRKNEAVSKLKEHFQKPKMAKQKVFSLLRLGLLVDYKTQLEAVLSTSTSRRGGGGARGGAVPMAICRKKNIDYDADYGASDREFLAREGARGARALAKEKATLELRCCAKCFQWSNDCMMCVCGEVDYCSTDCQRSHWTEHKKICTRGKNKKNKNKATKTSANNDEAVEYGLDDGEGATAAAQSKDALGCILTLGCSRCGKSGTAKFCPCKSACYCSKACQIADWKVHKKVCPWHLNKKA